MTSLWFENALLPSGWARNVGVTIAHGRISAVAPESAPSAAAERHGIAVPGLPNLHSHAFQRAMAGLTERRGSGSDSFWTWRKLMYRFAQRLNPDQMQAIAALAFVEMLESGFVRSGEFHYVHHQPSGESYADPAAMGVALAAAAEETGIGLTLLPVFYAASDFGSRAPEQHQRRFVNDIDNYVRLLDASERATAPLQDAIVGVAPHSLRAVNPQQLALLSELRPSAPLHIHVAEQVREVEACVAWSGLRPVEWLYAYAQPGPRWCLVHATHVTPAEQQRIAKSRAVVGLCPITEANLGDGLFPLADHSRSDGLWGVGSDSNVMINVAAELQLAEYGQRLLQRERNVLARPAQSSGRALFEAALIGGNQALGCAAAGIAVGAPADLLTLNTEDPALVERADDAMLDSWIFAAGRSSVDCVWRAGSKFVTDGQHRRRSAITARYRSVMRRLLSDGSHP